MDMAPAYDQKSLLFLLVLKTDVRLVQMLRMIILDFLPGHPSPVIGTRILMQ